jgi:hypothetical protein
VVAPRYTFDPSVNIRLEFGDRAVDFISEGDPVELVEHCLVEPLDDVIRLWTFCLRPRIIDILDRQVELVFVVLRSGAILRAAGSECT